VRKNFGHDYFCAHVTGKTVESGIPQLSMGEMWALFAEKVRHLVRSSQALQINASVLMCNHYHILCSSPNAASLLNLRSFVGCAFDDDNFIRPINHYNDYTNTYKYIYRNPVEAGLVTFVENYEFSSLHSLLGRSSTAFPVIDNMNLIFNSGKILKWLNSSDGSEIFGPLSLMKQKSPSISRVKESVSI
jgi:putative transposase